MFSIALHLFKRQTLLLAGDHLWPYTMAMPQEKVLVVEDDATLAGVIKYNLEKSGYRVLTAADGTGAVDLARSSNPDIIVLDIMLPGLDGLEVCRIIKAETAIPIIMLTARSEEMDKVLGLELGADDYITKPFGMREFLTRIKVILRRQGEKRNSKGASGLPPGNIIRAGGIEIDTDRHRVTCNDQLLELSPKEFDLLYFLVSNPGRVFSREFLLERVWGYDYAGDTRTVDVHIRWLREKIEKEPAKPASLLTLRGVGYKFEA